MRIISFEGIDACGKETQSNMLAKRIEELGFNVLHVAFPRYDTPIGKLLKEHFTGATHLCDEAVHMLLEADRFQFEKEYSLDRGDIDFLILDRYTLSNLAFMSAKNMNMHWGKSFQMPLKQPDVTFYLSIPVEESLRRTGGGRDKHERDAQLLKKVKSFYDNYTVSPYISSYNKIECEGRDVNEIFYNIWEILLEKGCFNEPI